MLALTIKQKKKTEIAHKRTLTICIKCDKGLHGTCLNKHKCKQICNILLLGNIFTLLEGYISDKYIENTYFLCSFWIFVRFQGGGLI